MCVCVCVAVEPQNIAKDKGVMAANVRTECEPRRKQRRLVLCIESASEEEPDSEPEGSEVEEVGIDSDEPALDAAPQIADSSRRRSRGAEMKALTGVDAAKAAQAAVDATPGHMLHVYPNGVMVCRACGGNKPKVIFFKLTNAHSRVRQHVRTKTHKHQLALKSALEAARSEPISVPLEALVPVRDTYLTSFTRWMVTNGIPLSKLRSATFTDFLQRETEQSCPSESQTRRAVGDLYRAELATIAADFGVTYH